jgi:hypothetical protein
VGIPLFSEQVDGAMTGIKPEETNNMRRLPPTVFRPEDGRRFLFIDLSICHLNLLL